MADATEAWAEKVRISLVKKKMGINDLAAQSGYSRVYVSKIVNCKMYSERAVEKINTVLGLE